jgi:phospholipid/cholesterol/gamma-HCH transport system substrate-binding protein
MNRRIAVNLAAFGLLFAVLAVWAVRNVLHLQLIDKPYTVVAEFERSPGLRRDVEVAYLGTRIGTIGSVSLQPGHVEVTLRIDRGVELPADVTAAVRRKSAVGEPYVDLAPAASSSSVPSRTSCTPCRPRTCRRSCTRWPSA